MWLWSFDDYKLEKWELLIRDDLIDDPNCDWNDLVIFSISEDWGISLSECSLTIYKHWKSKDEYYIEIVDILWWRVYRQLLEIEDDAENIIWIIKDNMKMLKWVWEFEEESCSDGIYTEIYFSDLVESVYFSYWIWVNKNVKILRK